ncbi:FkbM family methyltransferase [Magnetovirga frankeli]|uniref:FkbM family methyltransferase n=1 Tax=Magnetovirga frankeli TaxID=947516 RepID=UPI001292FADD|nr:FkbM family methyltransferase [gamma proteobacterium SS-5]
MTKHQRKNLVAYLKKLGFTKFIDAQYLRAMTIKNQYEDQTNYYKQHVIDILKPLDYLADEESRLTYTKNVISHLLRSYDNARESNEKEQYFISLDGFRNNFNNFIDCGAYTGDTFNKLININPNLREYIGFEPNPNSYNELVSTTLNSNIKTILFQSAVSNKTGLISFDENTGSSKISKEGKIFAKSIRLDETLINYPVEFLKMDIEGEEINALIGARELINNNSPQLAISIYHYINHFWEVPNLINSWNLNYNLFIRSHSSACMETVLYAQRNQ